jgi:hypothetical protein
VIKFKWGKELMKSAIFAGAAVMFAVAVFPSVSSAEDAIGRSVNNAYRLCAAFDQMGILSKKCDVSGWHESVDISVATTAADALSFCRQLSKAVHLGEFEQGWTLRIFSPYSGDNTIGICDLAKPGRPG